MTARYELLRPGQVREILKTRPLAYLPWGSHEWHGTQNPLGTDSIKAHKLCELAAEQTGGIVFPLIYLGHQTMKPGGGFRQTFEFSETLIALTAKEYLEQLVDEGFKVIVVLFGHYGSVHMNIIHRVIDAFCAAHPEVRITAFADFEMTQQDGYGGDHAGKNETSYMLRFFPEYVDLDTLPPPEAFDAMKEGVHGGYPPVDASAELGQKQTDSFLANLVPHVNQLLAEVQACQS